MTINFVRHIDHTVGAGLSISARHSARWRSGGMLGREQWRERVRSAQRAGGCESVRDLNPESAPQNLGTVWVRSTHKNFKKSNKGGGLVGQNITVLR